MDDEDRAGDPVIELLLHGDASTCDEAEERYLECHLDDVARLAHSSLSDTEFRRHPLISLLLARGSRGWDDSLT